MKLSTITTIITEYCVKKIERQLVGMKILEREIIIGTTYPTFESAQTDVPIPLEKMGYVLYHWNAMPLSSVEKVNHQDKTQKKTLVDGPRYFFTF